MSSLQVFALIVLNLTLPLSAAAQSTESIHDIFSDVAYPVGELIDNYYKNYRELLPIRNAQSAHKIDLCDSQLASKDRFADRIAYAVAIKSLPSKAQLSYISSYYGLPKDNHAFVANSLLSHPLCNVTAATLQTTLNGKNIPGSKTIAKVNDFANRMNLYRKEMLAGSAEGELKAHKLWSKYLMCLSYVESLTSADTAKSQAVAQKYAPSGYRKPAGVKFYEDPWQDPASRLNIGLFQFTPTASGNVQACLREWNLAFPKCAIKTNAPQNEMIPILGSSLQTFNTFCAAAKLTGMFSVQLNTVNAKNTPPQNKTTTGSLKKSVDRCVTPHMATGLSYNHFGPFQNSTGDNLESLMACTLN